MRSQVENRLTLVPIEVTSSKSAMHGIPVRPLEHVLGDLVRRLDVERHVELGPERAEAHDRTVEVGIPALEPCASRRTA